MIKIRKTLFGKLIAVTAPLFAAATFSACYGPGPNMRFDDQPMVTGSVTDSSAHTGINEIVVSLVVTDANGEDVSDSAITVAGGKYYLYLGARDYSNPVTVTVKATDVDGADNGGKYTEGSVSTSISVKPVNDVVLDIPLVKE